MGTYRLIFKYFCLGILVGCIVVVLINLFIFGPSEHMQIQMLYSGGHTYMVFLLMDDSNVFTPENHRDHYHHHILYTFRKMPQMRFPSGPMRAPHRSNLFPLLEEDIPSFIEQAPLYEYPGESIHFFEAVEREWWLHPSVRSMTIQKLIECLPSGMNAANVEKTKHGYRFVPYKGLYVTSKLVFLIQADCIDKGFFHAVYRCGTSYSELPAGVYGSAVGDALCFDEHMQIAHEMPSSSSLKRPHTPTEYSDGSTIVSSASKGSK